MPPLGVRPVLMRTGKRRERTGVQTGHLMGQRRVFGALNSWHVMKVPRAWVAWERAVPSPRPAPQMHPLVGIAGKNIRLPLGGKVGCPSYLQHLGKAVQHAASVASGPELSDVGLTIRPVS